MVKVDSELEVWDKEIHEAVRNAKQLTADRKPGRSYLSEFQIEKLTKLFTVWFDQDKDGKITIKDFELLNKKIFDFTGWSLKDRQAKLLITTHNNYFACLLDTAHPDDYLNKIQEVALDDWLNMWGNLSRGAMSMSFFPHWAQLLPQVLFLVIDRNDDGFLQKDELRNFYEKFVGVNGAQLDKLTDLAFKRMTGNGDHKITMELYEMIFANFILGKTLFGPGPFVLGVFDPTKNEPQCFIDMATDDEPQANKFKHRKPHFLMNGLNAIAATSVTLLQRKGREY